MSDKNNKQPASNKNVPKTDRPASGQYRRETPANPRYPEPFKKSATPSQPFNPQPPKPPKK